MLFRELLKQTLRDMFRGVDNFFFHIRLTNIVYIIWYFFEERRHRVKKKGVFSKEMHQTFLNIVDIEKARLYLANHLNEYLTFKFKNKFKRSVVVKITLFDVIAGHNRLPNMYYIRIKENADITRLNDKGTTLYDYLLQKRYQSYIRFANDIAIEFSRQWSTKYNPYYDKHPDEIPPSNYALFPIMCVESDTDGQYNGVDFEDEKEIIQ